MRVKYCLVAILFFFSSRRRHTRCGRDWSSDVCSSDLNLHCRAGCRGAQRKFVDLAVDHFDLAVERYRVGFVASCRRGRGFTQNHGSCRIEGRASQTLELSIDILKNFDPGCRNSESSWEDGFVLEDCDLSIVEGLPKPY